MIIEKGDLVSLRPAEPADRRPIYEWLAQSDITHMMLGPPTYPDAPVPDWEEFSEDYPEYFFDGSAPLKGRCYIIEAEGRPVGQINHDVISGDPLSTWLDIWLRGSEVSGKGYGPDAIQALCRYLKREYRCSRFLIAPSGRNRAAVKAYQRAGFRIIREVPADYIPDYTDDVILAKEI